MNVNVYQTTFCNSGHDTVTGNPIEHECYRLPVAALEAEKAGDTDRATELLEAAKPLRRMGAGILARVRCPLCKTAVQPTAKGSPVLMRHGSLGWSCDGTKRIER